MEESNIMCEIDWPPIVTLIIGMLAAWVTMVNVRNQECYYIKEFHSHIRFPNCR
jgi:hypothetical protein